MKTKVRRLDAATKGLHQQLSAAIFRTQLFSPDDIENVKKVQAGYNVQMLSAYLNEPSPPPAPVIDFPKFDKEFVKTNFFAYLDFALQFAPEQANETEIRAQLARIGVGSGKTFNFKDLSLEDKLEIALGMKEGERKVEEAVANAGKGINGWRVSALFGDSAFFNGNWLKRAAGAKAGIYGNDAEEATYPGTRTDSDGQTLDGSQHNYTLTFAPGQPPPVNAFWAPHDAARPTHGTQGGPTVLKMRIFQSPHGSVGADRLYRGGEWAKRATKKYLTWRIGELPCIAPQSDHVF